MKVFYVSLIHRYIAFKGHGNPKGPYSETILIKFGALLPWHLRYYELVVGAILKPIRRVQKAVIRTHYSRIKNDIYIEMRTAENEYTYAQGFRIGPLDSR